MATRYPTAQDSRQMLDTACRILQTVGVEVQSARMRDYLLSHGGFLNKQGRVCVPEEQCRDFLSRVTASPLSADPPFTAYAEICEGQYLDPFENTYKPWNWDRLLFCVKASRALEDIDGITMLGCPIAGMKRRDQIVEERLFGWKYGVAPGGSIWNVEYCEPLYRLYEAYATLRGSTVQELFQATVFLISPLCFGREEGDQMMWFRDRGIRLNLGVMSSIGGSAALLPANMIALHLAEAVFVGYVNHLLFGTAHITLAGNHGTMDMKTGTFKFGRPESVYVNNAVAELARHLGTDLYLHTGLTDAVTPSPQAAFEKVVSCLYAINIGYQANFVAGLIGTDEVFSPIQMVLDGEMKRYLSHIHRATEWDTTECLADLEEALEYGSFLATDRTAFHCREHSWLPKAFAAESFKMGQSSCLDNARAILREIQQQPDPEPLLTPQEEAYLRKAAAG